MISEKEREALMRLTMCARGECPMCKYEEQCDNWDFRMELATKNMNILADALRKTEPIIYGNEHNCMMTIFGECSYAETGCGDCAVVEKVRNALDKYEPKDEPLKTTEYCNYCDHKGCEDCIANNLDDYCVPSNFEEAVKDKPQLKEDGELEILTQTIEFPDTHQRFIFTRSIRADGDCLIIGDWEYKGKEDEPQTKRSE